MSCTLMESGLPPIEWEGMEEWEDCFLFPLVVDLLIQTNLSIENNWIQNLDKYVCVYIYITLKSIKELTR